MVGTVRKIKQHALKVIAQKLYMKKGDIIAKENQINHYPNLEGQI